VAYLLDTSVLARLANASDEHHSIAANAVLQLHRSGELLHVTPQVFVEFRNVATQPSTHNGRGLSIDEAETQAAGFEAVFDLLPDTSEIFQSWKQIVSDCAIIGKQVHDARLVTVCRVHRVTHLLTFNDAHFTRMAACSPRVIVLDPQSLHLNP
jgi:predicted nucleic acid-binding protein